MNLLNHKKNILFIILILSSFNLSANDINILPKKVFELDLTDEKVSTQGGGLQLLKAKDYCILVFNLYGEMGQEKYVFKFKNEDLISTRHVGYKYPTNIYEIQPKTKFILDFDKTYKARQNKFLLEKFNIYKKRIPSRILMKNCQ